jgi:ribosomal protein S12 methylthiotransferase accessory factor
MKFPSSLNEDVKIRLAPDVSTFIVDSGSLFIKHDNQLFRLPSSSDEDKRSRILDVLKEPKKLVEITDILAEFRKKDLIAFLRNLYKLNLIELEESTPKSNIRSGVSDNGSSTAYNHGYLNSMTAKRLVDSKILLIGDGILINKVAACFRSVGIQCKKMSSSIIGDQSFDQQMNSNGEKRTQKRKQLRECGLFTLRYPSLFSEYDLMVAAQDYPNITFFETVNKICFNKKKPWLRVSFDDNIGFLGPLVIPGQTSCYNCCQLRLVTNSPYYEYFLWKYKEYIPKPRLSPSKLFTDVLSAFCVNEVITYLTKDEQHSKQGITDHLLLLDTQRMHLSKHKILPHPCCMHCNTTAVQKWTPLKLRTLDKVQTGLTEAPMGPTGHTTEEPDLMPGKLLEKLKELEDEKTGVVINSEKLFDSNRLGIKFHHFYKINCYKPLRVGLNGKPTSYTLLSNDNFIEPSPSGSGDSPTEAEISALMEAVERYSSMVVEEKRLIWSTYSRVEKIAINPLDLVLYPNAQYDRAGFKCSRYSPDSEYPWIEGLDLFSGKRVLVPADFVFYPPFRERPLVLETSNGAAAHTDIVQATLNGLYEVIERDSFLVMWLNKLSMPALDIKRLPFGFNESLKLMDECGIDVKLVHILNDTNIPTVMAVCYNKAPDKYPAMVVGTASHIEPEMAIKKALFEMEFQLIIYLENPVKGKILRPNQISASYEHPMLYLNPENRAYWDFMISSDRSTVLPRLARNKVEDTYGLLMRIVRLLSKMNHKVIRVDITPPDMRELGLNVVKVLVTGFQPLYFKSNTRLSLDRLNTVPSHLGFNTKAGAYRRPLNVAPHPLP